MTYDNELKKLKSLVSKRTWELLESNDAIIAGGAITSVFCNRDVNDLDIYLRREDDFFKLIIELYSESNFTLIGANMTNRSILFRDKETKQDVQLIVYKFFPTVEDIFNDYDFTVNMGALSTSDDQFHFHADFFKHNSQRYLQFHTGTTYPLISALRAQKYKDKGYTISKAQMLRLLLTISKLEINSWDDIKDHCGGFYGLNMDEVFPEDKEFSLELVIEILDQVFSDNKFKTYFTSISESDIYDKYFSKYNDTRINANDLFFKNVRDDGNGIYLSPYKSSFKYVVGNSVNGGGGGIYCYNGYDVLSGMYNDYTCGNVILQLEKFDNNDTTKNSGDRLQLMGEVIVVAKYTKLEFIRKFKRQLKDLPTPTKFNFMGTI
jgi:hypothetical protein